LPDSWKLLLKFSFRFDLARIDRQLRTRRSVSRRRGKKVSGKSINSCYALFALLLAALPVFFSSPQSVLWKFSRLGSKKRARLHELVRETPGGGKRWAKGARKGAEDAWREDTIQVRARSLWACTQSERTLLRNLNDSNHGAKCWCKSVRKRERCRRRIYRFSSVSAVK
jgi:hypothetical protein